MMYERKQTKKLLTTIKHISHYHFFLLVHNIITALVMMIWNNTLLQIVHRLGCFDRLRLSTETFQAGMSLQLLIW